MTRQFLFLIAITLGLLPQLLFSQNVTKKKTCYSETPFGKSKVFTKMENKPSFKGGHDSLLNFIMANINYKIFVNALAENERLYNDTARVKFIVSKEGIVSDLSISLAKKKIFAAEVIRLIKKSSCQWNPGNFGRYVNSWFQFDIFYLIDRRYNEVTTKIKILEYDYATE